MLRWQQNLWDLGICYIGGLRNDLQAVTELLNIPYRVIPLFGLVVGYPAKIVLSKSHVFRLANIYHENSYQQDKQNIINQLEKYNETISKLLL